MGATARYSCRLRLHLAAAPQGLPAAFALTGAKADERRALLVILADPARTAGRVGQISIGDRNYYGHDFEADQHDHQRE